MKSKSIDIEKIIAAMEFVPLRTPWFYVLYAYIVAVMRLNKGNRTRTSKDIAMPLKSLRYKFGAMRALGFIIPESEGRMYEQVQINGTHGKND